MSVSRSCVVEILRCAADQMVSGWRSTGSAAIRSVEDGTLEAAIAMRAYDDVLGEFNRRDLYYPAITEAYRDALLEAAARMEGP